MFDDCEKQPIEVRATEALGQGFDLASDFRRRRDVVLPGGATIRVFPESIRVDKADHMRFKSVVLQFKQMSEVLNQKSLLQGKVPSGYLNAIFELRGVWLNDAADAEYLAFNGYFISLYHLHLTASPLELHDYVKNSVPYHWDPALLSRFNVRDTYSCWNGCWRPGRALC